MSQDTAYGTHVYVNEAGSGRCSVCGLAQDDGRAEHVEAEASDEPVVVAHIVYEWDCDCGETNRVEQDPSHETVTCEGCGRSSYCSETR